MEARTTLSRMNDSNINSVHNLEPIPFQYGIATVLSTIVFFQIVNKLFVSALTIPPKSAYEKGEWQRRNLLISWIHALFVSVWDITL